MSVSLCVLYFMDEYLVVDYLFQLRLVTIMGVISR